MIDLEVVVPFCFEGKYLERFFSFSRYGLFRCGNNTVRVVALMGTSDREVSNIWNVSQVRTLSHTIDTAAAKVYNYYHRLLDSELDAKWYLRVDDDSSTDVLFLLDYLNETYKYTDIHHMCAHQVTACPLSDPFNQWLGELGYPHLPSANFFHDWEVSLTYQESLNRIKKNQFARELFFRGSALVDNWTDMGLSAACRMCGINTSPAFESIEPSRLTRKESGYS